MHPGRGAYKVGIELSRSTAAATSMSFTGQITHLFKRNTTPFLVYCRDLLFTILPRGVLRTMAGFGFSPADIVEGSKFAYKLYRGAHQAREQYTNAREFADCARITLEAIESACDTEGNDDGQLKIHIARARSAYDDLDEFLGRFNKLVARPDGLDDLSQKLRWSLAQLNRKTETLKQEVTSMLGLSGVALVARVRCVVDPSY